jgi:hypothetical protein
MATAEPEPMPLLVVPVGLSIYRRLLEVARAEGLDLPSTVVALLSFQLGSYMTARARRQTNGEADTALSCLNCGRSPQHPGDRRCSCGGIFTRGYA